MCPVKPGSFQIPWEFPDSLGVSRFPGSFQTPWEFPDSLGVSRLPGSFQIFWEFPDSLGVSRFPGSFQIPWEFPDSLRVFVSLAFSNATFGGNYVCTMTQFLPYLYKENKCQISTFGMLKLCQTKYIPMTLKGVMEELSF
jgi:hypothetical protein